MSIVPENRRSPIHLFAIIIIPCVSRKSRNLFTRDAQPSMLVSWYAFLFYMLSLPLPPPSSLSSSSSLFLSPSHLQTYTSTHTHTLSSTRILNVTIKFEFEFELFEIWIRSAFEQLYRSRSQESWCTHTNYYYYYYLNFTLLLQFFFERNSRIVRCDRDGTGREWVDWSLGGIQGVHRAIYKFTNPILRGWIYFPFLSLSLSVISLSFHVHFCSKNPSFARLIFEKERERGA